MSSQQMVTDGMFLFHCIERAERGREHPVFHHPLTFPTFGPDVLKFPLQALPDERQVELVVRWSPALAGYQVLSLGLARG